MKVINFFLLALVLLVLCSHVFPLPSKSEYHANTMRLGETPIGPYHRTKRNKRSPNSQGQGSNEILATDGEQQVQGHQQEHDPSGHYENYENFSSNEESSESDSDSDEDSQGNLPSVETFMKGNTALLKLMSESSDLAKEVSAVFELLSSRESALMKEMQGLKGALNGAVNKLKSSLQEEESSTVNTNGNTEVQAHEEKQTKPGRYRRQFDHRKPYKACVSIEPAGDDDSNWDQPGQNNPNGGPNPMGPRPRDLPSIQEYIPSKSDPVVDKSMLPDTRGGSTQQNPSPPKGPLQPGEVDLSQVYWLRLAPNKKQEVLHDKVSGLLRKHQGNGQDVLVIPVSNNFQSTDDVVNGFLRAVRLKPAVLKSPKFRQIRSLHIYEL